MLTSEIVAKIIVEGGFDATSANVSSATVLGWVNELYAEACSESGYIRVARDLSPTVVGGAQYALADDVVDVRAVRVGTSQPYVRMSTEELWEAQAGRRGVLRGGSAFAPNFESDGDAVVEIWPASSGATVQALCAIVPSVLTVSPDTTPKIPPDLHNGLVEGGIGLGQVRIYARSDLAAPHTGAFEDMKKALKARKNSRVGSGAVQAKIWRVSL